ncbi:recombinase family protein [Rugamonas fusca]|uniref:recombinase family protein n=1 Tax=Rugamonas fusca TaxID=2758568 RepID=UPI001E4218ED|nr:recombinase family protein [Rugamonas fusca]
MLIGYARVSADDQHLDLQCDALTAAGCERIFEDTVSGAKSERTGQTALMNVQRAGDMVVIWRLDRLGRSLTSVYRVIKDILKPRAVHRVDHGRPRILPRAELERYCEVIAALKLRTTNRQGRHLSTKRAIELLEDYGVETDQGMVRAPAGVLTRSTVNEYLTRWRLDQGRLRRQSPAVRFQAECSNDCWQFDMSPSDLKRIDKPHWVDPVKGEPTLTRHGYRFKDMVEQFDAKPAEIRALFSNQLDPVRTAELRDRTLTAGLPI